MKDTKDPLFYKIVRPLLKWIMRLYFHPKYIGIENVPKKGRFILAGNHKNNMDPILLISSTKRVVHFLGKKELFKDWRRHVYRNMGIIPVDRSIHDKNALASAIKCLEKNMVVGIFPEGTFNKSGNPILPFKIGCVKMASETDTPIIPCIIKGDYKFRSKNLTIEFLEPVKVKKVEDLTEENEKLMDIFTKKLEK